MLTIFIGALLIGVTLGLLGSGGSTITVPVLVYLVGHSAKISIAESMAIVGMISMVAAIPYARTKQVDWQSVGLFGVPGMLGTLVGAWIGSVAADAIQLVVFGSVLILSAAFMIRKAFKKHTDVIIDQKEHNKSIARKMKIIGEGMAVGILTGFVGVGGGFLIVPALVVFGKLPMRLAIGTSLVIIAFKSAIGFAKYQHFLVENGMTVDWQTIVVFGLVGVAGSLAGQRINEQLNQRTLQKGFAFFLVIIGCFVILTEGSNLIEKQTASSVTNVRILSSVMND